MADDMALHDAMDRLGATALDWKRKAERYETALMLIASHAGQTLLSMEHGQPYSVGANAAFEELASIASAALNDDIAKAGGE